MLRLLSISNIAVISRVQLEFGEGLNLLTGETGSGKSIIVDALELLFGARASQDIVRSGESCAYIEALFDPGFNPALQKLLASAGVEFEDEIIIRREIPVNGRSRIFINDRLSTASVLRSIRPFLLDIHGQGEQQTLLDRDAHLDLLDTYAGLNDLREEISFSYKRWKAVRDELNSLQQDESERLKLLDMLEFQKSEIERAKPFVGEDAQLYEERNILVNAERIADLASESYAILYEQEASLLALLAQVRRRVEELSGLVSGFNSYIERLDSMKYDLEDIAFSLRDYLEGMDFSQQRLREVEERIFELDKLKKKYGPTLKDVLEHYSKLQSRLDSLNFHEEKEKQLQEELERAKGEYLSLAKRLREERQRAALKFEGLVVRELAQVAMEKARFNVKFDSTVGDEDERIDGFTEKGIDRLEFLISANAGEELRPLSRVASGGELSRLMLVLKTIATPARFPRTLIFDEIDSGIGGRVAEAVGLRLKKLAASNQVLCVTHQAQIARFADVHLSVAKIETNGRTETVVMKLDEDGRVEELARMLAGSSVTTTTLKQAKELLAASTVKGTNARVGGRKSSV